MKRTLMAAACLFGMASATSATTLDPLALFTFDNGLATDDSGNGNNGTLRAGTSAGPSRDGSTALNLTPSRGTSGLETTININKSAMLSMSMGGWVFARSPGVGIGGKFLSHDNGAYGRTLGIDARGDSAGSDFAAFAGSGVEDANGSGALFGSWVHLAVVYNGAASGLYVNGVLDSTFNDLTTTQPGLTQGLFIGTNNYFDEDFDGLVDDVFVFDRALTAAEVATIHADGFAAPAPVPLPAGLPLMLGGMIGFAALRRAQKS